MLRFLSVELSPNEFSLEPGQSLQLQATVQGEGDFDRMVVWKSSDTAVATVVDACSFTMSRRARTPLSWKAAESTTAAGWR